MTKIDDKQPDRTQAVLRTLGLTGTRVPHYETYAAQAWAERQVLRLIAENDERITVVRTAERRATNISLITLLGMAVLMPITIITSDLAWLTGLYAVTYAAAFFALSRAGNYFWDASKAGISLYSQRRILGYIHEDVLNAEVAEAKEPDNENRKG